MRLRRHQLRAARRLPEAAGRAFRKDVPRRSVVQGGLGLVTGAILGGLSDSYDPFLQAEPTPEPEPDVAPAPEPQPEPQEVEPEPEAAPEPEPEGEPEPEPEPEVPAELRRGSSGDAVRELQEQLNAGGYWCGTPDGGFGHLTQQAVWAVQKANGLYRDGIVGPATRQALASGSRPAPVAGGTHVEVHVGSQLLLVVRGGATAMVLNTSTGNGEPYTYQGHQYISQTPTGDFTVGFMDGSGWRDGELGEMWRPMFYDGNYAIHGSASIPPYPASHGCARVSVAAMDMIWADGLLGMGGRVVVV